jgi:hypothetical protein
MLENTYHAGKYISCWTIHTMLENIMLENTYHSGKYIPCWKIRTILDNTYHAGQCIPCYVNKMKKSIFPHCRNNSQKNIKITYRHKIDKSSHKYMTARFPGIGICTSIKKKEMVGLN